MPTDIIIKQMREEDIDPIVRTFTAWNKQRQQYEKYLAEQERDERFVLVAYLNNQVIGYGTIVWKPLYRGFREHAIPEIIDLNVINAYQGRGIGSAIITAAEQVVRGRGQFRLGISVVQTPEYTTANRLYPRLGFIPDGTGITMPENQLHLVKDLTSVPIQQPNTDPFSIRLPVGDGPAQTPQLRAVSKWLKQSLKRLGSGAGLYHQ